MRRVVEAGGRGRARHRRAGRSDAGERDRAGRLSTRISRAPGCRSSPRSRGRRRAGPGDRAAAASWRLVGPIAAPSSVTRPPGVRIDAGGIAKGVFADELAATLAGYDAFVVDCGGDMRLGGRCGPAARGARGEPVRGRDPAHVRPASGRRRHQRHRPAQLDRPRRTRRPPPARPRHRPAGVHRRRPGHRAGADRHRGGDAEQGGAPERPGARRPGARARRRDRPRRRGLRRARPAGC